MKEIFFFVGVHGVGKGTFINQLKNYLDIEHYTASEIIEREKNIKFSIDKEVEDIDGNQNYLLNGIKKIRYNNFILDGHFTLRNKNTREITPINIQDISQLGITKIILLKREPATIYEFKMKRDNASLNIDEITDHQFKEIEVARQYASQLNIPLLEIDLDVINNMESINSTIEFLFHKKVIDMKLVHKYFFLTKENIKKIEFRKYDEKRLNIVQGNIIRFLCVEDEQQFFYKKVVSIKKIEQIETFIKKEKANINVPTNELISDLENIYGNLNEIEMCYIVLEDVGLHTND